MVSRRFILWEVDAQADFMLPGGKLYVPGAEKIIPNLKRLVDLARESRALLISSTCSHTPDDPEFQTFPPHCIRGTSGARIVPEGLTQDVLTIPIDSAFTLPTDLFKRRQIVIEKQVLDVFSNPHSNAIVEKLGGDAEFIVFGVVTEYCVNLAAKGLLERNRKVALVKDAIRTIKADEGRRTIDELMARGARLVTTNEALAAVV
jgi:nicotinamidase/pyrazinamidase